MKHNIPIENLISRALQLGDLDERVLTQVRKLGFHPFAMPKVPKKLRPFLEVEYNDTIYTMSDPEVENLPESQLQLVPPTDLSDIDDDVLHLMLQYFASLEAAQEGTLAILRNSKNLTRTAWDESLAMVQARLIGKQDPETGKMYSKTARKEAARHDPEVVEAYAKYIEADALYSIASKIQHSTHTITESLNRQRMAREEQAKKGGWRRGKKSNESGIRMPPPRGQD